MTPNPRLLKSLPGFRALLLLAVCVNGGAVATDSPSPKALETICKQVTCRPATNVRLDMGQQRFYVVDQPEAPFVYDGVINVLSDETVRASARADGDRVADLSYVADSGQAPLLLVARLRQVPGPQGRNGMELTLSNPFDRPLTYKAYIQPAGRNQFIASPICPIPPGRIAAETWPYPIVQILLREFRFLGKNEILPPDCEPLPVPAATTHK